MPYPIEGNIAGKHPYQADGQRDPPSEDVLVGEHAAGDDR
jgi:hypothetical protein